ncbi:MAG: CCA tRNA nucleotidyltransferase [Nitrospirae bacterium]|nr:MAG: CCA tRNA nucleotidyltransferase [Nitrospirota bacterium]
MFRDKKQLQDYILSDPICKEVFEIAPTALLVGGFIRDAALYRESTDRDFIVQENIVEISNKLKEIFNASKVILKDNSTIRLVLKENKDFTIDLSTASGDTIRDLQSRDFTINSIAFNPEKGIIDPTGGLFDLEYGLIRSFRRENLLSDPLRMLRAYRFLAELNGDIEEGTRLFIMHNAGCLVNVATERITLEITKLFEAEAAERAVISALKDGVLEKVFSIKEDKLSYLIKNISYYFKKVKESPEGLKKYLDEPFDLGLSLRGVMLLEIIAQQSSPDKWRMSLSRKLQNKIRGFLERSKKARCLFTYSSSEELYDCLKGFSHNLFEFIFLSGRWELFEPMVRYMEIEKKPLINGTYIISNLAIKEGTEVGRLLDELKRAQFCGYIKDKTEAIDYLKKRL